MYPYACSQTRKHEEQNSSAIYLQKKVKASECCSITYQEMEVESNQKKVVISENLVPTIQLLD
jgi:hypothetical protein